MELYFHKREDGDLVLDEDKDIETYRDMFVAIWQLRGWTDEQIQERW